MKSVGLVAVLMVVGVCGNYGQNSGGYGLQQSQSSGGGGGGSGYGTSSQQAIPITKFIQEIKGSDSSNYEFETGNRIRQSESTQVVQGRPGGWSYHDEQGNTVTTGTSIVKTGSVAYTSPEGQNIQLSWIADENGFQATGDHLPTSPPIPQEIAASLNMGNSYGASSYSPPPSSPSYSAPPVMQLNYGAQAAPSYSAPPVMQLSYGAEAAPSYSAPPVMQLNYGAPAPHIAPLVPAQVSYGYGPQSGY